MDTKIYTRIAARGYITEREILTIKHRANRGVQGCGAIFSNGPLKITPEQTEKGLAWLMDKWKTPRGVVRKRNPFKQREQNILEHFDHFELGSFYDGGSWVRSYYYPIYRVYNKRGRYFDYIVKPKDKYTPLTIL